MGDNIVRCWLPVNEPFEINDLIGVGRPLGLLAFCVHVVHVERASAIYFRADISVLELYGRGLKSAPRSESRFSPERRILLVDVKCGAVCRFVSVSPPVRPSASYRRTTRPSVSQSSSFRYYSRRDGLTDDEQIVFQCLSRW